MTRRFTPEETNPPAEWPPDSSTVFTYKPLIHGKEAAIITYVSPYHERDPNLKLVPYVAITERPEEPITMILADLITLVEEDVLPRFVPFFP